MSKMPKVPKMSKMNERQPVMARDVKKFAKELEERTRQFSLKIIRLSSTLPNTPEGRTVRTQMTKSGTSVVQITEKRIAPGAKRILGTRLLFARLF
jgi:hypothetical protein